MLRLRGLRNILNNKNVEDIKKGGHDVTRFIKRTSTGKNGEKASDHYTIDPSVIDNEEKYDGYYAVATNLNDDTKAMLEINSKRYKIEDCFRIQKTLQNMNVMNTQDAFYTFTSKGSQVCTALNGVFDLGLDKKYYLPKELNKKIKKFQTKDSIQHFRN